MENFVFCTVLVNIQFYQKKKTFGETQLKKINIIITQPSTKFYKNKYNYNYQRMTSIGQETH